MQNLSAGSSPVGPGLSTSPPNEITRGADERALEEDGSSPLVHFR